VVNLNFFASENLFDATRQFFNEFNITLKSYTKESQSIEDVLGKKFEIVNSVYTNYIDDSSFQGLNQILESSKYKGMLVFSLDLAEAPKRAKIAELTRAFNRKSKGVPVCLVLKYSTKISLAISQRTDYKQEWREGEKVGKVIILRDVDVKKTHSAHRKILEQLKISKSMSFENIHNFWMQKFSIQTLNNDFYGELQKWFDFAKENIKLPHTPEYIVKEEHVKNFLVRLLTRILFCWFVKEKHLIRAELLEITDSDNNKYKLTNDIDDVKFLDNNSYYRGILQNIFFNALNKKDKDMKKDFKWTKYWHKDFDLDCLKKIPYLNGGIFDCLDEDNAKESIEDSVIKIPNYLFYGNGKQRGLNEILKSYYFTLEENTPFDEDIALDPEMLGMVFENLLAELDPNLEEKTKKSIKNLTGSYYTPKEVIYEMVNESLSLYLSKKLPNYKKEIENLIYKNEINNDDVFNTAIVEQLDRFKMLDPACGSGAFPMGMLHKLVDILSIVDENNKKWIALKLQSVDLNYRDDFEKTLVDHMRNYSRKLGIIRDSIYGIDIQPLAIQITKLRFFISLLIDQKDEITPMPNIETKIICADSLKNITPDLFSDKSIEKLIIARRKYYQPNLSHEDKEHIAKEIVDVLNVAFPSFSKQITGKSISGQNKALLHEWFTHGTLSAPFFNMDFFYPELKDLGFDCVIGNPPYGGTDISDDVRMNLYGVNENNKKSKKQNPIGSKDPYGAFISRFMSSRICSPPLKKGGVLAFIVSDTFMTIKSHLPLRKQMMYNYIHKMIRVHPDTFRATVNTAIIICERNCSKEFDVKHICQMVDMTNISIHNDYDRFTEILHRTEGINFINGRHTISNTEYAIYYYPQQLIKSNRNLPFFVASPKLFALMNDCEETDNNPKVEKRDIDRKSVVVRKLEINGKEIEVVKLGDVEKVAKGMDSAIDYVYRASEDIPIIRTHYSIVDKNLIRNENEIIALNDNQKLNGVKNCKNFIIPFNKGGSSDSPDGWLPNYYIPIEYYIDWTTQAVKKHYHRNPTLYFNKWLTFSFRGEYSPTFRLKNIGPFDANSSFISTNILNELSFIGLLSSKLIKFIFKSLIQHTIASDVDKIKEIPIILQLETAIIEKVKNIIANQKSNPRYDYASHEQIEIDKLVYEAYGLSPEDIEEVENWYARRYSTLSEAQKQNLRNLGKSDDYLVLYGYKKP
jgi:hypothetical protein